MIKIEKEIIKGKIEGINTVIMEDFTTKYQVSILMEKPPKLKLGECEVTQ